MKGKIKFTYVRGKEIEGIELTDEQAKEAAFFERNTHV